MEGQVETHSSPGSQTVHIPTAHRDRPPFTGQVNSMSKEQFAVTLSPTTIIKTLQGLAPDSSAHLWHLNGELCALGLCILESGMSVPLSPKKKARLGERSLNLTYTWPESTRN